MIMTMNQASTLDTIFFKALSKTGRHGTPGLPVVAADVHFFTLIPSPVALLACKQCIYTFEKTKI